MDTELERIGYYNGENSWSKILYDGEIRYVSSGSVTTQKPITDFTDEEETVYLTQGAYVFTKPSHLEGYSTHIKTLSDLTAPITRLGVAQTVYVDDEGNEYTFAKILFDYDGTPTIGYMNNAYLTTEAPANPDGDVVFEENSDILLVIADQSIALRKSTSWIDGDNDHNNAQIIGYAEKGQLLQATFKGTESDDTVWYKVVVEDITYYVIFRSDLLEVQDDTSISSQTIFDEYTISLPEDVVLSAQDESVYMGMNNTIAVTVINTGALPAGAATSETLLQLLVQEMGIPQVQVQEKNGIYYFETEYEYTEGNVSVTEYYLGVVHEGSNNNFYFTCFIAETDIIDTFWGYVDTISITPAA